MEKTLIYICRYLRRNPKLLLLGIVSGLSVGLWVLRVVGTQNLGYIFMLWNLFLALLPLLVAKALYELDRAGRLPALGRWIGLGVWLLLVPNAPYMITDLIHLGSGPRETLWFDALLLFSFAMTGLLAGVYSWYIVHRLVDKKHGSLLGGLGVLASSGLIAFGIYLGRFGRWNSWDILSNPLSLGRAMWQSTHDPLAQKLTFSFTFMMLLVYIAFYTYYELRESNDGMSEF